MTEAPNTGRSIWAVGAGFLFVVLLSLGTDEILHLTQVYPPWNQPMWDPGLNALALGYRLIYGILGNLLIHRLAPWRPMKHVWVAAVTTHLGPVWYPVLLAASVLPSAWVTAPLYQRLFPST
jgi:hypothetical protein